MALKPLTPVINSGLPFPGAPPAPIKGRGAPRPSPHLTSLSIARFQVHSYSSPSATASPFCTTVARPPQLRPSSGETRAKFPSLPSPFCVPAGELWCTGAAGGQAPVSSPPCPLSAPPWVHDALSDRPGPTCVDLVHEINRWKIIRYSDYSEILQRGP
jgi:hypothetical protein